MTPNRHIRWSTISLVAILLLAVGGCASIPTDALKMTPDTLERRQLQTRRFDGVQEKAALAASAGVLQDLGFNIDESETRLGVIVASKERSAVTASQVTGAVLVALLGGGAMAIDKSQKIRVSLVARPVSRDVETAAAKDFYVRVTFQRLVWNTQGQITRIEAIDEPEIYQQFFSSLSKSLFLEAQEI